MKPEELKRKLNDAEVLLLKQNWVDMRIPDIMKKWETSERQVRYWAKVYKLGAKPRILKESGKGGKQIIPLASDNPIYVQLLDDLTMTLHNPDITYDERVAKAEEILLKMYANPRTGMSELEAREHAGEVLKIIISREKARGGESATISEDDKKAIEKHAVEMAFYNISIRLSDAQRKFFDALLKIAADKALAEERARNEIQDKQQLSDGIEDADFKEEGGTNNA